MRAIKPDFDQSSPACGRTTPNSGRTKTELGRTSPEFGRARPTVQTDVVSRIETISPHRLRFAVRSLGQAPCDGSKKARAMGMRSGRAFGARSNTTNPPHGCARVMHWKHTLHAWLPATNPRSLDNTQLLCKPVQSVAVRFCGEVLAGSGQHAQSHCGVCLCTPLRELRTGLDISVRFA